MQAESERSKWYGVGQNDTVRSPISHGGKLAFVREMSGAYRICSCTQFAAYRTRLQFFVVYSLNSAL